MIKSLFSVGMARIAIIAVQLGFIAIFANMLPVEELGKYSLIISIVTPILWFFLFDAPVKIISESMDTNNIFIVAMPSLFMLPIFIFFLHLIYGYYDNNFANDFYYIVLIYLIKYTEVLSEVDFAVLRHNNQFSLFSSVVFTRNITIYGIGSLAIFTGLSLTSVLFLMLLTALFFLSFSISRLHSFGWTFKVNYSDMLIYISKNKSLGVASGLKFFSSNIMRYFSVFQLGVSGLGYLTPVFYSLTAMTNIATIFENVFSKHIVQTIAIDDSILHMRKILKIVLITIFVYLTIILIAYGFSESYYRLFFTTIEISYQYWIVIFAIGWLFYLLRSLLKALSFRFKMQYMQLKIQLIFNIVLIISMSLLYYLFPIVGIPLSFLFSSIIICLIYLYKMREKISLL